MAREIRCDVLVIGAGASGVPAAIAAAREGVSVILLDDDPYPGGTAVDQFVSMPDGGPRSGIVTEMMQRLESKFSLADRPVDQWWYFWYMPADIMRVVSDMLAAEPNLRLLCPARASRLTVDEIGGASRVTGALVHTDAGEEIRLHAGIVIEATGVGALAEQAGCDVRYGEDARGDFDEPWAPAHRSDEVQQCTWMYISTKAPGLTPKGDTWVPRGLESGHGTPKPGDAMAKARGRHAGIYLHWGCRVDCRDTRDPVALAEAQRAGLELMKPAFDELREHGYVVHLAPRIGVRETRRIMGEAVVTANDLVAGRVPDDSVLVTQRPIDIWRKGGGGQMADWPEVRPYGIPYRALVPREIDGLYVVGKSMSGTHLAMASYRVQCLLGQVGQAAGVAAAMCVERHAQPRDLVFDDLLPRLTQPPQNLVISADLDWVSPPPRTF